MIWLKLDRTTMNSLLTKPFNAQAIYAETLNHYLTIGKQNGWKHYVWSRLQELEKCESGMFVGITKDFLEQIKNEKIRKS